MSIFSGFQKIDGLAGNLVVRVPKANDPNGLLYDCDLPEHKIFISDWLHLPADDHFPGLRGANKGQEADAFLINGKGRTSVRDMNYKLSSAPVLIFSFLLLYCNIGLPHDRRLFSSFLLLSLSFSALSRFPG
jgi:hypothetical protein